MGLLDLFSSKSERNEQTLNDAKDYLSKRYDLLKLELLEKSSQILSVVLSMLIIVVCAVVVLVYLSSALISWLTLALNAAWAYTIVCGLFLVIILVVLKTKDKLFVKPFIRKFSRILYKEENTEDAVEIKEKTNRKGGPHE
ncbi:MAG: phage holin family protein [Bacteroidales bacterium]|nr:phage holin family protein [Bacteroidales bacterium]